MLKKAFIIPALLDLCRHLTRNLVCPHGMFVGLLPKERFYRVLALNPKKLLLPVAKVVAKVHQGQGDSEPHGGNSKHGGEGDRATRVLAPDEEVDKETDAKHYTRVEGGCQEGSSLPFFAFHGLVEAP